MATGGLKRAVAVLALGGATVMLGGAAANTVWAQQTPTTTTTPSNRPGPSGTQGADRQAQHQQFLTALAAKLNVTPERLQQLMDQTRQELGLPERGPGGPGGPGGHGGRVGERGMGLDAAAQAIGIDSNQLRQELAGKSLADVARAHNVDPSAVASALKSDAITRIDQAVSAGRLTAEQAAQMKQNLDARIDQQLNRQAPADAGQRGQRSRPAGAPAQGETQPGGSQLRGGPRI